MLVTFLLSALCAGASQVPLNSGQTKSQRSSASHYQLPGEIKHVAVIGAGPNGLLHAATLLQEGFSVRLFEKAPQPGGVWFYTDKTPIPASFPNKPLNVSAYTPDIPDHLPYTHTFDEGDDGVSNDFRIREHWIPSPAWSGMLTTAPPCAMSLPNINYPPDIRWRMHRSDVQRYVRQYASSVGLNSNDDERRNVTSYFTRVERLRRTPYSARRWELTLRKMTPGYDGGLKVEWWTETFDAVVVAVGSKGDSTNVPPIPGLVHYANALPEEIVHSRDYRRPDAYANKNILIVGGFVSAMGISRELLSVGASVTVSARPPNAPVKSMIKNAFSPNVTFVPEIEVFGNVSDSGFAKQVKELPCLLANGTTISGFDHVILATGFRTSLPFLVDFHNSSAQHLGSDWAPILTDGSSIRSLHWTGHYIDDPTLAFASHEPWYEGPYQALGFAKVWQGKARLPSPRRMWNAYPGAGYHQVTIPDVGQKYMRLLVTWLNEASLEFGGRLIAPPIVSDREAFSYFVAQTYPVKEWTADIIIGDERTPRSEWDAYRQTDEDGSDDGGQEELTLSEKLAKEWRRGLVRKEKPEDHWADFSTRW